MCTPAIAIGIATGLMSAVQSIASFQSQSQAAKASERAYQQQRQLNAEAANTAYQQAQLKLKGEFDQAAQKSEELLVNRLQSQGTTLSAGRGGQSISSLLADAQRVEGKDLGSLGMNLANSQTDYFFSAQSIFQQQQNANVSAASQRTPEPSVGGLVLGLAGAGLSGYSAFASLKAPTGFTSSGSTIGGVSGVNFKPSAFSMPKLV
jgi:hypothetical protein